jgi:hypothetical protein
MVFRLELSRSLVAVCAAILSHAAVAQTAPPDKRPRVDVRSMAPGAQAPEALAEAKAASGLTRDQRKDAALQARQEGSLLPAGEATDPRGDKAAPVVAKSGDPAPAAVSVAQPQPDAAAGTPPPTLVAAAVPPAPKKRKKARTASAPA